MRSRYGFILLIVVVSAALLTPAVLAGSPPAIYSVSEGKEPGTGQPTLTIAGKGLTHFVTFNLAEAGTAVSHGSPEVLVRKSTDLVLRLPADLAPGAYVLSVADKKGVSLDLAVSIGNGRPLPGSVRAESLDTDLLAGLRDAGNLTGTVSADRFSAFEDLGAEGKVGTGAAQVAAGDHDHDARYPTKSDLSATGTINTGTNPVDWTQLKGVPAGIADGTDDADSLWTAAGANVYRASGRVGVGATAPAADLHVNGNDGVLFTGTYGSGTIPTTGAGTRMMWYPGKAALRAGISVGAVWDDSNIGNYSIAFGKGTNASGTGAIALGENSYVSGYYALAAGYANTATGWGATALGSGNLAGGTFSTAMGEGTTALSYGSFALGRYNVQAGSPGDPLLATDQILMVGNGTTTSQKSNALTLLRNGNLTIAGTLTQNSDLRMKKDVVPLAGVLARISGIHGVSYEFKDTTRSPEGRQIGLVAQEVRAAFPELVREDTQGTLSVSYQNFTAVLLEAVKEQQATIEAKEKEIAEIRRELAETKRSMEERLTRVEELLRK